MLPFHFVQRSLLRRPLRTAITAFGVALTTLLVIAMHAFSTGLSANAMGAARDDVVVLVGTTGELDLIRSVVPRGSAEVAAAAAPRVREIDGRRAASVELHVASRSGDRVGLVRGVTDAAWLVHPAVTVVAGREPRGPFEVMVGTLAAPRMGLTAADVALGSTLRLGEGDFEVVGQFRAPGTLLEAEIWGRLADVQLAHRREDVSCVVLWLEDPEAAADVDLFAARRVDLEVAAIPEPELLAAVAADLAPIAELAGWLAVLSVAAGALACANTMFAAVLDRTRELATLRTMGYTRFALGLALVEESALIALLGGAAGMLTALAVGAVPLRYPLGALLVTPEIDSRAVGLGSALLSGLLGGLVPALRALRLPLVQALGGRQ